ncbi:MAG TPA: TIGR00725 family protein [Desulfurococcales archaeon]|nr:TIGR00725 family protein [Desulfurococcales archaeon]
MKGRYIQIGVAASSDIHPLEKAVVKTRMFVRELSRFKNVAIIMGGGGGLMNIVSEEAYKYGIPVIGVVPLEIENVGEGHYCWNPFNTFIIKTGVTFPARSIPIVRSSDSFVVLGGGIGTMIEALLAYECGIPTIIIDDTGYPSDNLKLLARDGYFDHRRIVKVEFTSDPREAAIKAYKYAISRRGLK